MSFSSLRGPRCAMTSSDATNSPFLASLMNHFLLNVHFPANWKCAQLTHIPKKNENPLLLNGYRPITILSSSLKIFERTLW